MNNCLFDTPVWKYALTALLCIALTACSRPADPNFANSYDESSDWFIKGPDMNTFEITDIAARGALSGGGFLNDYGHPITVKGVCWSASQNPTISDNCTNEGSGLNTFTSRLNNLQPDVNYFVRAYAANRDTTVYGNQRSFRTPPEVNFRQCGDQIADNDGNVYSTVQIGNQCWIAENFRSTKYLNGDAIPQVTESASWADRNSGAWSYFNNNSNNNQRYGKLYNYFTVSDIRGICPAGWKVPDSNDIQEFATVLVNQYSTEEAISSALRSTQWDGNNRTGFNLQPAGMRYVSGTESGFQALGFWGTFWTNASRSDGSILFFVDIPQDNILFFQAYFSNQTSLESRRNGHPVRCLKRSAGKSKINLEHTLQVEINQISEDFF